MFAIFNGGHEGAYDAFISAGSVECLFDGEDVRVDGGGLEEVDDAVVTFVGVMQENVLFANELERIGRLREGG